MSLPQIIGITGCKFNGKDTMADYIVKKYGYEKMSVADPLKNICKILFGFNDEQLYGSKKEVVDDRWGVTPRDMLQYIGTDMFRKMMGKKIPELNKNDEGGFWVKCLTEQIKIKLKTNPSCKIIIPDIRFQNELDAIKKLNNNLIIRIKRPSIINKDFHESEKNIDTFKVDCEILNDTTLDELYTKINN